MTALVLMAAACSRSEGSDGVAAQLRAANVHLNAARVKMAERDGPGCLADLDAYDQIDTWRGAPSTDATSPMATMRGMCLMLAGHCSEGRALYRAALKITSGATLTPEMLDRSVDTVAALDCQGHDVTPRDELLRALMDLNSGAYLQKTTSAQCKEAYATAERLLPQVPPRDDDDTMIQQGADIVRTAGPECFAHAGDCAAAWIVFHDEWLKRVPLDEARLHDDFVMTVRRCADP